MRCLPTSICREGKEMFTLGAEDWGGFIFCGFDSRGRGVCEGPLGGGKQPLECALVWGMRKGLRKGVKIWRGGSVGWWTCMLRGAII